VVLDLVVQPAEDDVGGPPAADVAGPVMVGVPLWLGANEHPM
jgi:hypothetical protein